jgi:phosphoribosylanthranilate isomerase
MFVKICGITNRDDAMAAIDSGARALGFIFYPKSPRFVNQTELAKWIGHLPHDIWKIGVFVDEHPATIEHVARELGLDVAQLHGSETPADHPANLRVWKAFRVKGDGVTDPDYPAEAILLDGPASGEAFDWAIASLISRPLVLAGGLNEHNVRDAIERTGPWGVDVCSGVESEPGRKDHARMKKFIETALVIGAHNDRPSGGLCANDAAHNGRPSGGLCANDAAHNGRPSDGLCANDTHDFYAT